MCGTPDERKTSSSSSSKATAKHISHQNQNQQQNNNFLITEAEFYFALDAAKLLTGPENVSSTNFDEVTGSRLARLKVDDELHEEDNNGGEDGSSYLPPPTSDNAALTGTIVPGGLTVYQFLNIILKFAL